MKPILGKLMMAALMALILSSCGAAAFYAESGDKKIAAVSPGLLSKQIVKKAWVKNGKLDMGVEGYASRQPDPDFTKDVTNLLMFKAGVPVMRDTVQGQTAVQLKGTEDVTKVKVKGLEVQQAKDAGKTATEQLELMAPKK
jgi:hypothetical protein